MLERMTKKRPTGAVADVESDRKADIWQGLRIAVELAGKTKSSFRYGLQESLFLSQERRFWNPALAGTASGWIDVSFCEIRR